eukprot:360946-Chlamydomonas_euryale.AAC.2
MVAPGGTSRSTTLPAPILAPEPTTMLPRIDTPAPTDTSFPSCVGAVERWCGIVHARVWSRPCMHVPQRPRSHLSMRGTHASMRPTCVRVPTRAFVHASSRACVHAPSVRPCARACICPCLQSCMRPCAQRASMCPGVHLFMPQVVHASMHPHVYAPMHASMLPVMHASMPPCMQESMCPRVHALMCQCVCAYLSDHAPMRSHMQSSV